MRFLTRYDGEVSEPLVGRQGSRVLAFMVKEVNNGAIFPVALDELKKSLFICLGVRPSFTFMQS